jgi:hypothetical protein
MPRGNQALLVAGKVGGGEVRHGFLLAAQGPSVGEEVKGRDDHTSKAAWISWNGGARG